MKHPPFLGSPLLENFLSPPFRGLFLRVEIFRGLLLSLPIFTNICIIMLNLLLNIRNSNEKLMLNNNLFVFLHDVAAAGEIF